MLKGAKMNTLKLHSKLSMETELGKSKSIPCDNQAVVRVLSSGRTRDRTLAAIARNFQMIAAWHNIDLKVHHIMGKNNQIADLLSR